MFDEEAVVRLKRDGTIDDSFSSAPIEAEVHVLDEDDNLITADRDLRGFRVRRYEVT